MTFLCVYCNTLHPDEWRSVEHVIPEKLYNKTHVLKDVCKHKNQYLAHSFETRFMETEPIKEIMLLLCPPTQPRHIRKANTSLGEMDEWSLPSGAREFNKSPEYTKTDLILMKLIDQNGDTHTYNLHLPFFRLTGNASKRRYETDRKFKRSCNQVNEYLRKLSTDPSLDPEFAAFLKETNTTFNIEIQTEVVVSEGPPVPVSSSTTISLDVEQLNKFFFKIAWTHAASKLGRSVLSNPIADWILSYILSGHIADVSLLSKYPDIFLEPKTIGRDKYSFWKYSINQIADLIENNEIERNDVLSSHVTRLQQFNVGDDLIRHTIIDTIDERISSRPQDSRFHEIKLMTVQSGEKHITACSIKLFGGIFDTTVQLSNEPLAEMYPPACRIEFAT